MNGRGRTAEGPRLTVVIPVLDGIDVLARSVEALERSTIPPRLWELVAVDDGSSDGSGEWVRTRGHRVLTVTDGPRGPAYARNLGAAQARGSVLVFIDADVCVHPQALERFDEIFQAHDDVGAAFGAYDETPADGGWVSQYRNLYHRFVHLRGAGDTETFWAGCGAVRTEVFLSLGGFDEERFPRPQIEDIELGYRIRDAGYRIILDPTIEGTHLKRWTLPSMVRTDFFDRGLPWMRLLLAQPRPRTLNVGVAERVRTALVGLGLAFLLVAAMAGSRVWVSFAVAALALNVVSNAGLYRWLAGCRGWPFALSSIPLNLLYYCVSGAAVVAAVLLHFPTAAGRGRAGSSKGELMVGSRGAPGADAGSAASSRRERA